MSEIVLCGAGGYARTVLSLLLQLGYSVPYILDDEPDTGGRAIDGVPIHGSIGLLPDRADISAFLAISDNRKREDTAKRFKRVKWITLIHPAAWVDPSAKIGAGTCVAAGAIVNADAIVGDHVMVDAAASVGHDCIVADFAQLEPGARLGGGARLGHGVLCRIGAAVLPGCSIGDAATIGPRSVALKNVPAGETWFGVPARAMADQTELKSAATCAASSSSLAAVNGVIRAPLLTVLISSAGRRVELIRCFQADAKALGLKVRVLAVDTEPSMSSACQAADAAFEVAPCNTQEFLADLLKICAAEKINLLVPTIDPELQVLAEHRREFKAIGTRLLVSTPEIIRLARDKASTADFLNGHGIRAPRTVLLSELLRRPESLPWPVILKPISGSASLGICIARDLEEASEALQKRNDYVAQELIKGVEYTVNLFFSQGGKMCAAVPHQRCEVRAGEVSKGITRREPRLLDIAWRLGSILEGATGVFCFQAMLPPNGEPVVFEINARFGGGYPIAHEAGATFTRWLLEECAALPSSAGDHWQEGITMLRYDAAVFRQEIPET